MRGTGEGGFNTEEGGVDQPRPSGLRPVVAAQGHGFPEPWHNMEYYDETNWDAINGFQGRSSRDNIPSREKEEN